MIPGSTTGLARCHACSASLLQLLGQQLFLKQGAPAVCGHQCHALGGIGRDRAGEVLCELPRSTG